MNRKKLLGWSAAVVACIGLTACTGSEDPGESAPIAAVPLGDASENGSGAQGESSSSADSLLVPAEGPLSATPPSGAALPSKSGHELIVEGAGAPVLEGDTVQLEYVVVSWKTGQVVKSTTEEFGGPQSIVLGEIEVPRNLENAIFQQPVGSRLQVVYQPDLYDLPEGLDRDDAYVVAVDIISRTAA